MSTIITFGNQKGGVGKSTLCTLLANYLSIDQHLYLVDCDAQRTISKKRETDLIKYPTVNCPYVVDNFDINDSKSVIKLMQHLKSLDGYVLIDSPGHLSQEGLLPLFGYSDIIVCPFQYEVTCLNSTITFLGFIEKLKSKLNSTTSVYLVPNRFDKRYGTQSELALWEKTDTVLSRYGTILPKVPIKADLQRYNTLSLLDIQEQIIQTTFQTLLEEINL